MNEDEQRAREVLAEAIVSVNEALASMLDDVEPWVQSLVADDNPTAEDAMLEYNLRRPIRLALDHLYAASLWIHEAQRLIESD